LLETQVMRSIAAGLGLALVMTAGGCASRKQAGDGLVLAGAITAVAAGEATTGSRYLNDDPRQAAVSTQRTVASPYSRGGQTSKNSLAAGAGVAAGIGLAGAGAALLGSTEPEARPKRRALPPPSPNSFRLIRPADDPSTAEPGSTP
jgi:hypothetical protein